MKTEIEKYKPCDKGLKFRNQFASFEEAWNNCERGDWMLWIAKKVDVDFRKLTLAKALCANTVRHLIKNNRSLKAIDVAISFGNGYSSFEELNDAASNATKAASNATKAASNATKAAYTAASTDSNASYAAYAAVAAADAAADAAYTAANAADAYAATVSASIAEKENRKQTADICREILTNEVFNKIKQ